jgi:predicted RNase H-like HicB family nuclease
MMTRGARASEGQAGGRIRSSQRALLRRLFEPRIVAEGPGRVRIVLEPSEEGGYTVYVPSLPGCVSEGNSREEALANIKEAIELYLAPVDDDLVAPEGSEVQKLVL